MSRFVGCLMRYVFLLTLLSSSVSIQAAEQPAQPKGNLHVLSIAIDQFPNKEAKETLHSYDFCAEEFTKVFREAGKSLFNRVDARMILGPQVTHPRCLAELTLLIRKATRRDLVVFSLFAHGFSDPKAGWGIATADKQILWGQQIKALLGQLPCQAIVVIETCTSGGFAKSNRKDAPLPPNVTALCARRAQQAADNYLSIALSEALWGKADFDKDGVVELQEVMRYVRLRHKELAPDAKAGKKSEPPLLVEAKTVPDRLPLTQASPDLVAVAVEGQWYQARGVKKNDDGKYLVHVLGWASKPGPYFLTDEVDRDHICFPTDPPPIKVGVKGKTRLARLLSKNGDQWQVQYLIGKKKEDTVSKDKVQLLFGEESNAKKGRKKK